MTVRRLHDTGLSGFWLLVGFIPAVGPFILIYLLVRPGTKGINKFGADFETGINYTGKAEIKETTFGIDQKDEVADLVKEIEALESLDKCIVLYYLSLCRCGEALAPFDSIIMKGTFMGVKAKNSDFLKIQNLLEQHLISHNSSKSFVIKIAPGTEEKELIDVIHKAIETGIRILLYTCSARKDSNQFFRIREIWSKLIESIYENQKLINSTEYEKGNNDPASIIRGLYTKTMDTKTKCIMEMSFLCL